ncbi:M20/M25/M40 family metallo-hydrolase [Arsenicicoccus dermatophilus]|uniref:M20/M25/M40 family metallo-hydrolase n=1 Tax=Arsenicicoccus dermatophilus TaxID=1076331 RepID=UPI0039174CF7
MSRTATRPALAITLATLAVTGLVGSAAAADTPSPLGLHQATSTPSAAPGGVDRSTVWIVSGAQEYARDFAGVAPKVGTATDKAGAPVVISTLSADRLAELHKPKPGFRCAGFRAFSSRAEAEAFIASDLTRQTVTQAFATYTIDNQATVNPWLGQVDHTRIKDTIQHLSTAYPNRYYASTYGKQAAEWIKDTWSGLANGRSDVTTELFTGCSNCSTQPSVLMTVKGSETPDEIVVIGGHIDSISDTGEGDAMKAPGADDDASGTATVTEIARVALASGWKPKRTVVFAGYAAEEVGLRGSAAVAKSFKASGKNVVGVLQLDMTNYRPASGPDMDMMMDNVNEPLTNFVKNLFDTYLKPAGLTRGEMKCGYGCSDHASWTSQGYPSAMPAESELFSKLHTTSDNLETLGNTAQPSEKFAKLGLAFLGELAKTSGATPAPVPTGAPTSTPTATPTTPAPTTPAPTTPAPTATPTSTPTATPTAPPTATPTSAPGGLQNDVPLTGLSGARGSWTPYTVEVPAGASMLTITATNGRGVVDLYVKQGSAPTTTSYDCHPTLDGQSATCRFRAPKPGTYHIALRGYSAYSGATLKASWQ